MFTSNQAERQNKLKCLLSKIPQQNNILFGQEYSGQGIFI